MTLTQTLTINDEKDSLDDLDFSSGSYNAKWTNGQSDPTRVI